MALGLSKKTQEWESPSTSNYSKIIVVLLSLIFQYIPIIGSLLMTFLGMTFDLSTSFLKILNVLSSFQATKHQGL